jgi:hypothetical protein
MVPMQYKRAFKEALRHYCTGAFTDDDIIRCTGMKRRGLRELIKVRAVRTITEGSGRGRVRLYGPTTLKRVAGIAALNQAGFSLETAGRISALPPLRALLYGVHDPRTVIMDLLGPVDPATGLPHLLKKPLADWFDPNKPATADPQNDFAIEIYDGRFVALNHAALGEPMIYGELRDEGTRYVAWLPFPGQDQLIPRAANEIRRILPPHNIDDYFAKWNAFELPDQIDPRFLKFEPEKHHTKDDPLCIAAEATVRSSVFKTSVNLTLAIRKTLRRYLGIDPLLPDSEIGVIS